MNDETDVIIVGAGLAGLVAATELVDAGRRVIILEQEPEASLGGHGYRALEGTFLGGCLFSGRVAGRAVAQAVI